MGRLSGTALFQYATLTAEGQVNHTPSTIRTSITTIGTTLSSVYILTEIPIGSVNSSAITDRISAGYIAAYPSYGVDPSSNQHAGRPVYKLGATA